MDAFEEVVNVDEIAQLAYRFKARPIELVKSHGGDISVGQPNP